MNINIPKTISAHTLDLFAGLQKYGQRLNPRLSSHLQSVFIPRVDTLLINKLSQNNSVCCVVYTLAGTWPCCKHDSVLLMIVYMGASTTVEVGVINKH